MTIFRYHDYAHYTKYDVIATGELRKLNLDGDIEFTNITDLVRIRLKNSITPLELARHVEKALGIKHIRVCGAVNSPCNKVSLMCGTPNWRFEELQDDECEILLVGEACEWSLGEYARDAAQLGYKKALLFLGHVGSERDGMEYVADVLKEKNPELEVKYYDCGEVYTYTD